MKEVKEKIAIFDFCETLVPFQSLPAYIQFTEKYYGDYRCRMRAKLLILLQKLHLMRRIEKILYKRISSKQIELYPLLGMRKDILEASAKDFYQQVLKKQFISDVVLELKKLQKEGFRIVLLSGGLGIYLQYFAEEFNIAPSDVLCTNLAFEKNRFSGRFDGLDCMRENKFKIITSKFSREDIYSIFYTDSITDLPVLNWVDKGIVVVKKDWISENKFERFVWTK